jgi:hypothetical protein
MYFENIGFRTYFIPILFAHYGQREKLENWDEKWIYTEGCLKDFTILESLKSEGF